MEHRRIKLSNGLAALVDAADYARLSRYHYYANRLPDGSLLVCRKATAGKVGRNGRRGHRLLAHDVLELPPGSRVRYANGDRLDCRKANLKEQAGCVYEVKGTAHGRKPYRAIIAVGRRKFNLGYWPKREWAEWACKEATEAARQLRGRGLPRTKIQKVLDVAVGREG